MSRSAASLRTPFASGEGEVRRECDQGWDASQATHSTEFPLVNQVRRASRV
jgi:hypothetical protein